MKFILTAFLILIITPQKRIINHQNFDYEFYISQETVKNPKENKMYYWYRSGEIHQSSAGIGGAVLVDSYQKFYKSKQLAEKGNFKNGLKHGVWHEWLESGALEKVIHWKKGVLHGKFISYNKKGEKIEEGNYRNGQKQGAWINYDKKDTLSYKSGKIIPEKANDTIKRESFFKRIFKRKKETSKKGKKDAKAV
ncbi:hypothetical protein [uncultured Kordia sp.]|uniref:toxin-antitoxin system YwqK family antitoxin n=1 Tax=uncultured Kordia sp. TaxID=507699 RepID=UPI0026042A07|nr:hypothetical protein [uncultured Kordia sp.]